VDLPADDVLSLRMTALLLSPSRPAAAPAISPGPAEGAALGRGTGSPTSAAPAPDVAGVVTWLGAMQAQDLASGLWSLGIRLPGASLAEVEAALEAGEVLRTWPMRGTVHFVPSRDARWMVEILGERPLARASSRRAVIGLDGAVADRAVDVLGEALAGGRRLTRAQCLETLATAGVPVPGQHGYHLLWYASQRGVTCIAGSLGGEQAFALLDDWAPDPHRPERDEALGIIALRYFRGHGPATRQDFTHWTGLTAADARRGLAVAGDALTTVRSDGRELHLAADLLDQHRAAPQHLGADDLLAVPGFDEYMLGFKDRALFLAPEHLSAVVPGGNGIFRATLVRQGRVIGTWTRALDRGDVLVKPLPLVPLDSTEQQALEDAWLPFARFHGAGLRVQWS